ncbi:MAG TPA: GNAT family N-acetyltransferase [Methylomirabilota bacterium]|nr:GNAT family N-acetyltransferase [Methylomirabilota bacterium]
MPLKTYTLSERPALEDEFERLAAAAWPRFLRQGDQLGLGRYWPWLFEQGDFQLLVCDGADRVVAAGHTIPIDWDGTPDGLPESMVAVLRNARETRDTGRRPTALSALAAMVSPERRGQGLSSELIRAMAAVARQHRLSALVAPVRPTLKASYPLAPMERYVRWTRSDGAPLDPWIRVHWRLGAEIVRVVPRTLLIAGRVADWEAWTEMAFPDTGPYVVPGALQPVVIDRERDEGRYEDPNVWMQHPVI